MWPRNSCQIIVLALSCICLVLLSYLLYLSSYVCCWFLNFLSFILLYPGTQHQLVLARKNIILLVTSSCQSWNYCVDIFYTILILSIYCFDGLAVFFLGVCILFDQKIRRWISAIICYCHNPNSTSTQLKSWV